MKINLNYIKFDETAVNQSESIKRLTEKLASMIDLSLGNTREKSLALTNLEQSFMWVGKAIRDGQIRRNGDDTHLSERSNE